MNVLRWADLAVGMDAQFTVTLDDSAMRDFAVISGDANPLHADEQFARDAGFAGVVAFGMLTSSFYSRLVGTYLPGRYALLHGIDIDFRAPAYVGDRLTVDGRITHLNEAYRRIDIKARIVNQVGTLVSTASIRAGVHEQ